MFKMVIYTMVLAVVYLVVMNVVNKKLESIDFGDNNVVEVSNEVNYYTVSITGAVNNPGSYTVSKGEKLGYLVTLAGGLKENADSSTYDLSAILSDNTTYYIGYVNGNSSKVSINDANIAQLDTLPGIGNVLAKRIVSYRSSKGKFTTIDQIKNVSGIGDSLFEQIKDLICL